MSAVAEAVAPRELNPAALPDHLTRLYRAAWAMCGCREDAEDLVQETYARVLSKRRVLRGGDELGYLLRVLRNTYVSSLRTADRRPQTAELVDWAHPAESRTSLCPEAAVEASEVFGIVAGLPDQYRDALVAVDVAGLSYREAAKALKTREGTIMSRLYRARQQVARTLG
jgi:RNA polymerase sigma-70 factor (ECF subfamily)